jgi:hypothetical protein
MFLNNLKFEALGSEIGVKCAMVSSHIFLPHFVVLEIYCFLV